MANPEIYLPSACSDEQDSKLKLELAHEEVEKPSPTQSAPITPIAGGLGEDESIQWHYLTFEDELPSPAYLQCPAATLDGRPSPPECPDLKKYMSPFLWSSTRKNVVIWLSCVATMLTSYTAGSYSAGNEQMEAEWNVSTVAITVGVTMFTLGFGIAPMFLAPFSELTGRRPIFVITGIAFVVFQLCCALTRLYAGMIVSRFLVGCASSTFSTMVGGVVADIYHAKDRNTPMSLFAGAVMMGTGLGPLVSGFIAQRTTWRWIFYHQVIADAVMVLLIVLLFKETRGSVLLSRKAQTLNKWYEVLESQGYYGVVMPTGFANHEKQRVQRIRWKVRSDEERGSIAQMISISLYRPFFLLFTEPVVFFFSLWAAFSWGVLYLTFAAIPVVYRSSYNFDLEQCGAVFAAISAGSILSTITAIYQEKWAHKHLPKRKALLESPEGRLFFACAQSALLPIGLFWFGWTSFPSIPWIVPTLALGCATMGIFSVYLAVFNYFADTYGFYASSALAAQNFCRNMLAGAFPLFTPQMFRALTFQGAGSLLGGLGALLTLVPWVLLLFGPKIRARSKFAAQGMEAAASK